MQKIAILGGTFNPIHNGHLHLIKRFSEKIGFDRVILIPTKVPTHKGEEHLADAVHRVRMCRLAAKEFGYEVSRYGSAKRNTQLHSFDVRSVKT